MQYTSDDYSSSCVDAPYLIWRQLIERLTTTQIAWWSAYLVLVVVALLVAFFPQFWGLAMVVYSSLQLLGSQRARAIASQIFATASIVLGCIVAVSLIVMFVLMIKDAPRGSVPTVVLCLYLTVYGLTIVLFFIIPVVHGFLAFRRRGWTYLYHGFAAAFLLVIPLSLIMSLTMRDRLGLNGATTMVFASCLLLLARIGEARAVSRLSWFWTVVGLFFLRLHRWALFPGYCPVCGYNLHALTEPRCPECGRPFTPEEAYDSPVPSSTAAAKAACGPTISPN